MRRLQTTLVYFLIATTVAFTSCDAEDGMDGAQGEQGIAGQDGNANVTAVTVAPFPSWTAGVFLGQAANFVEIAEPLLSTEVVDDALVLVYFQLFSENTWFPMAYAFPYNGGGGEIITYTYAPDLITIYALSSTGPLNADITKLRYFIIPTSDAAGRSVSSRDAKIAALKSAGVDINNYHEVAAYYNLK